MRLLNMKFTLLLATAAIFGLSACATVTRGKTESVAFSSVPAGTTVKTSTGVSCETPCTMEISRKQPFNAVFSNGREQRQVKVITKASGKGVGTSAGNVLAGGVIGIAIDASSGAALDHMPNPVHADFTQPASEAQAIAEAYAASAKKKKTN